MVSVTQILKTFPEKELVDWQLRVGAVKAKQTSEEAKRVGNLVDTWIQTDLRNPSVPIPSSSHGPLGSPEASCWVGWEKFKREHPKIVQAVTGIQPEYHRKEIVGHPDLEVIFLLPLQTGFLSVKCARHIRPMYWTQESAYSWLKDEEHNVDFIGILRLDKERGDYEYATLTDPDQIDYEIQIWLCYKQLYEHRERVKARSLTQREAEVLGDVSQSSI